MNTLSALKVAANGTHDEAIKMADLLSSEKKTKSEHCDKHNNDFESRHIYGSVWSRCPICSKEDEEERIRIAAEKEAAIKIERWQRKLGDSAIPERFQNRTLDSYIATNAGQRSAFEFAKEYADEFESVKKTGRGAIFCGRPGTGKTHLSIGIALAIMEKGNSALFTTVQRIVRRMKETFQKDARDSERDVINMLVYPDLLIIDEIGVQFGTDFEKNLMFDILNERYENRKPTLLLSNLTVQEVKAFLGERIYDRLREDGGKCIPFDWNSHRGSA